MRNTCSIYVIKNVVNKKVYIGQTWGLVKERFRKHKIGKRVCRKLRNAFDKHGKDKFYAELILVCHSQKIVDYWETYFIEKFDSIKSGYNIKSGGSKGKHSEETKTRIGISNSIALKGNVISPGTRKKLSEALKGKKKPTRTIEHTTNIRNARRKQSKLNESIVKDIRNDYLTGLVTQKQLSEKYMIPRRTITDIVNYKIWK